MKLQTKSPWPNFTRDNDMNSLENQINSMQSAAGGKGEIVFIGNVIW